MTSEIVVDASVVIKLFVDEEGSDTAVSVFTNPKKIFCIPDLLFVECANVLWKKVRRGEYDAEDAKGDLLDLSAMDLQITPTAELAERAFAIACEHEVSAYDACYIALAEESGAPLVTADERLVEKFKNTEPQIITLSAIS